jgi:uncharacterized protein YvpB
MLASATHEAIAGQSLADVAREHGVSATMLGALNGIPPDTIFDEPTAIIVPGEGGNATDPSAIQAKPYIVVEGDTIETIAAKFEVAVAALAAANSIEHLDDLLVIGQPLVIPVASSTVFPEADIGSAGVFVAGVQAYKQARPLSCEYASVYIATAAFGSPISEEESIASTPRAENPHFGFRGDIDGEWGQTDDYGIYAEALGPLLEAHSYVGEVSYGAEASVLRTHLNAGHPVIVWIATRGDTGFYEIDSAGNRFKLVPWEHVVVVYGYDQEQVYIADPGPGEYATLGWDQFLDAWAVMDGMALAVYPM